MLKRNAIKFFFLQSESHGNSQYIPICEKPMCEMCLLRVWNYLIVFMFVTLVRVLEYESAVVCNVYRVVMGTPVGSLN